MKHTALKFSVVILLLSGICRGQAPSSQERRSAFTLDADGLVESAERGDLHAVQSILAAGIDVNARSKNGETALAASAGPVQRNDEIVELLLASGARVDDRSLGLNAFRVDTLFGLYQKPSKGSYCGNLFLELEEAYSRQDRVGVPALFVAAIAGRSKVVQLLLDKGAQADIRTFEGDHAIDAGKHIKRCCEHEDTP